MRIGQRIALKNSKSNTVEHATVTEVSATFILVKIDGKPGTRRIKR
jgi:hypothetical protein